MAQGNCAKLLQALLEGGADPDHGNPNALQCVEMFKMDKWKERFESAPGRGKAAVKGQDDA